MPEVLKVSVVIPTYNRDECLLELLECLLVQDYLNYEILVVDQSESLSPGKKKVIGQYPEKLKYYQIAERGRSLAKNYGITLASGDIVLFCDDDIIVSNNFISTHVKTFDDKTVGAVSCRLIEDGQPSIPIKRPLRNTFYGQLINKPYSTLSGYVTSLNGGNMSFRKEVLDKVGFFEEYFIGTSMVEEPDIAYRIITAGYKLFFNASITVFHYPQNNGNIAEMKEKRADWFYYYLYNLSIYYVKNNRIWNLIFVFLYSLLVCLKHTFQYRLGIKNYFRMMSGFFNGIKRGFEISKIQTKNPNYTPVRTEKKMYQPI